MSLAARLRGDRHWLDMRIRNLSRSGMMAECAEPPKRGTYIEVRRNRHVLIGLVVWSQGSRFGVRLSEKLEIDRLVEGGTPPRNAERRDLRTRPGRSIRLILTTPEDWRWLGQVFERAMLAAGICSLVATGAFMAHEALAAPLAEVVETLH